MVICNIVSLIVSNITLKYVKVFYLTWFYSTNMRSGILIYTKIVNCNIVSFIVSNITLKYFKVFIWLDSTDLRSGFSAGPKHPDHFFVVHFFWCTVPDPVDPDPQFSFNPWKSAPPAWYILIVVFIQHIYSLINQCSK